MVVVCHTRHSEKVAEPVDHVAEHGSLEFLEEEEEEQLVDLEAG
jgi:hypothetical protein